MFEKNLISLQSNHFISIKKIVIKYKKQALDQSCCDVNPGFESTDTMWKAGRDYSIVMKGEKLHKEAMMEVLRRAISQTRQSRAEAARADSYFAFQYIIERERKWLFIPSRRGHM